MTAKNMIMLISNVEAESLEEIGELLTAQGVPNLKTEKRGINTSAVVR